jgi:polysaccharide pyruvyl transferase WcaK-like protein
MLDAATSEVLRSGAQGACIFPNGPEVRSDARVFGGGGKLSTLWATAAGILASDRVVYIGADVLDGVYSAQSSLKRLRALRLAHRLGRRVRVLGASWSETPAPEVVAYLKAFPEIEVLARDPISHRRMEATLGRKIRLVADLGFLLQPEARSPAAATAVAWARAERAAGATILGVNLSGHTVRTLPDRDITPFAGLVARWLDADAARRIVLLPHDVRPGYGGDQKVLGDLAAALKDRFAARMHVPGGPLDAWDVKAITSEIDLALTGRMHLAIACLGQGTPPLSVVYQGKFEGLMQHFGLSGLTLDPGTVGTSPDADAQLEQLTGQTAMQRAVIKAELPRIRDLSRANFEGL